MSTQTMTLQDRAARALAESRTDWAAAIRARAEGLRAALQTAGVQP